MRATPRTDALERIHSDSVEPIHDAYKDAMAHSRQLERELSEALDNAGRNRKDAERLARGLWRLTKKMDMEKLADYDDELAVYTMELQPLAYSIVFSMPRQQGAEMEDVE